MDAAANLPPPPAVPPAPPAPRRRGLRIAFVVTVVLIGLVLAAPHAVGLDWFVRNVEAELASAFGVPCRVERLGFSWFTGMAVEGLEIGNPEPFDRGHPFLRLRRADGDVTLSHLVRGRFDLVGTIDGLQVFVDQAADGATNVERLLGARRVRVTAELPAEPRSGGSADGTVDLAGLRFLFELRNASIEIHRQGRLLESLTDVSCTASKGWGTQTIDLDLDAKLQPTTAGGQAGRLAARVDVDAALAAADAMFSTAGLDLARYQAIADALLPPERRVQLAGVVNGALTARVRGAESIAIDGELAVAGPRFAGPLLRDMDVRAERWTVRPVVGIERGAGGAPKVDAERFSLDLGFLRVRGLSDADARRIAAAAAPDAGVLGFAYDFDADALVRSGGALPAWLQVQQGRIAGELAVPFGGGSDYDLDRLLAQIAGTGRAEARRLTAAGFTLADFGSALELRGGKVRLAGGPTTTLDEGPIAIRLHVDLRDRIRMPVELGVQWTGGRLQRDAVDVLRYVVPMFAGLDAGSAELSGLADVELTVRGPCLRTGDETWLQVLDRWSGGGRIALRDGSVAPAPALRQLLEPLGAALGPHGALGDGARLSIDAFAADWTLHEGAITARAAKWLAKGKELGLAGTVRLDGGLDYRLDFSALLRGHRDGERVLSALGEPAVAGGALAGRLLGTVSQPQLGLPEIDRVLRDALQNTVQKEAGNLLRRGLDELLKKTKKKS
jgi:hypothetical protein